MKASLKVQLIILLGLSTLVLSSCGFHLRGGGLKLSDLPPIAVQGGQRYMARLGIERILGGSNGPLVPLEEAEVVINIQSDQVKERVLTINTGGKVTEYEVAYILSFELLDEWGDVIRPSERIVLKADYTFSALIVLAKDRERDVVEKTLYRRMAQRILRSIYQSNLKKH
jgi:LPS-assembly lipoprotein